jgi:DNA-binding transcriptional ArsR family regulator
MLEMRRLKWMLRANKESRSVAKIRADEAVKTRQNGTASLSPPKRKQRTKVDTRPSREAGEVPTGLQAMALAMNHPLRVKILYAMNGPERTQSASEIAQAIGGDVRRISYHMRELAAINFIEQVDERPVRGALEKIYAPAKRLEAWDVEWSLLPPAAKAALAASTLGLGLRALGSAIDSGDFGKRDDAVLTQSTIWTDERGAVEALAVLFRAAEKLIDIEAEAKARLGENGEQGFPISYLVAGYEGGLRPIE